MSNKRLTNSDTINEKFYTPDYLMAHLYKMLIDNNIEATEWLENSAGDGKIIDFLKSKSDKPIIAYDIHNESGREDIKECNYLKEKIEYKCGRVAFINPPFTKGIKFLYKALKECDYVASIMSINSLLNIEYDNYELVGNIYFKKMVEFGDIKVSIILIILKNKGI